MEQLGSTYLFYGPAGLHVTSWMEESFILRFVKYTDMLITKTLSKYLMIVHSTDRHESAVRCVGTQRLPEFQFSTSISIFCIDKLAKFNL